MTAPRLTASSLWRAEPCPASVVLPAEEGKKRKDAEDGNRAHAELAKNPPPGSIAEAAFAYNVLTGTARYIGSNIGREYGVLERGEIPGTLDCLTVQEDHVLVDDYKTGHGYLVPPLPGNPQLQHNSLCAALVHDKPKAIAQIIKLKTGEVEDAVYDLFDFAAISERLRRVWERAELAAGNLGSGALPRDLIGLGLLAEGEHCWLCKCKRVCPLKSRSAA